MNTHYFHSESYSEIYAYNIFTFNIDKNPKYCLVLFHIHLKLHEQ